MSKAADITGQRFCRLLVIRPTGEVRAHSGAHVWLCKCDCGNYVKATVNELREGRVKSCGCYQRDITRARDTKHGGTHDRLYLIWMDMRQRCYYPKFNGYRYYGGRGITVCDEWRDDYAAFRDWALAAGYDKDAPYNKCTIDRIDVNGNYCPENCRWVDAKTQGNNKRSNVNVTFNGRTQTVTQWADELGIAHSTLTHRLEHGWELEKALTTPNVYKLREKQRNAEARRVPELELALLRIIRAECCYDGTAHHDDEPECVYAFEVMGIQEGTPVDDIIARMDKLSKKIESYPK